MIFAGSFFQHLIYPHWNHHPWTNFSFLKASLQSHQLRKTFHRLESLKTNGLTMDSRSYLTRPGYSLYCDTIRASKGLPTSCWSMLSLRSPGETCVQTWSCNFLPLCSIRWLLAAVDFSPFPSFLSHFLPRLEANPTSTSTHPCQLGSSFSW